LSDEGETKKVRVGVEINSGNSGNQRDTEMVMRLMREERGLRVEEWSRKSAERQTDLVSGRK
jgi:hypothetical protein